MADFLSLSDLYARVGSKIVNGYFDDNNNGVVTDETSTVDAVLVAAEAELYSRLMHAWAGDPSEVGGTIQTLIANDPALKTHTSWIALQYAAERRPAFTSDTGEGPYKAQYDRAIAYFERIAKGTLRSMGEAEAGVSPQNRGNISPTPPSGTSTQFVFAPDKWSPTGRGGF